MVKLNGLYGSLDLTPLKYFLWEYLKTVIYDDTSTSLNNLKNKVTTACSQLTQERQEQITTALNREFLQMVITMEESLYNLSDECVQYN